MNVTINGHQTFVGQGGIAWQADQRTLVLQHGAGMDRTIWVLLARYFSRHGFNVVAPDLPAHGASKGNALTFIEDQAAHLWKLLDVLQAEHDLPDTAVILGGHSMGALVALEAAGQQVSRVEQLLLFGAGYPMPVGQALLDAAAANSQDAVDMIALFSHSFASQLGHNHVAGISVQNSAMALLERSLNGVLHTDLMACNAYQGGEAAAEALGGKRCTIIAGAKDRMTPLKSAQHLVKLVDARSTAQSTDKTRLVVLENCGHMMLSEQPEATLQAVRECLLAG